MNPLPRIRSFDRNPLSLRRLTDRKRSRTRRPSIESLESRALLSTVTWTNSAGGDWDTGSNWSTGQVPGAGDNAVINLSTAQTITLSSSKSDSVLSLTTNSSTTLKVINGSLTLGNQNSTLGGPVNVNSGATLSVGAGTNVLFESTITDAGALTFASGDAVSLYYSAATVSGSMTANGATFTNTGGGSTITFTPAAALGGGSDTYNIPLVVPYTLVPSLAGNTSFYQVEIAAGTISSGTLALNLLGTNTASFSYQFLNGFTIGSGGTVAVGANVPILFESTITDAGALTFASGDAVSLYYSAATVSGSMTANGATFTNTGGGSTITFTPAAALGGGSDTYNIPLVVPYTLVPSLAGNTSFYQVEIAAGTISSGTLALNLLGTNTASFSYQFLNGFTIGSGGTVAVGANVPILFESTITDAGALTFASGDAVSLYYSAATVSGSMTANGATFTNTGGGSTITFTPAAALGGGSNTYNIPLVVPYTLVPSLAGNTSFYQVEIAAGTISSGTLALNLLGTNTASFSYQFLNGFTIGSGGTVAVGANVPILFESTITDAGALTFASGDAVSLYYSAATVSGSMTANAPPSPTPAAAQPSPSPPPPHSAAAPTPTTSR